MPDPPRGPPGGHDRLRGSLVGATLCVQSFADQTGQLSEQESAAAAETLAEDVNEATVCDALLKGLTWR